MHWGWPRPFLNHIRASNSNVLLVSSKDGSPARNSAPSAPFPGRRSAMIGRALRFLQVAGMSFGRALVTADIKDSVPLDGRYRAASPVPCGPDPGIDQDLPVEPRLHRRDHHGPQHTAQRHNKDPAQPGAIPFEVGIEAASQREIAESGPPGAGMQGPDRSEPERVDDGRYRITRKSLPQSPSGTRPRPATTG